MRCRPLQVVEGFQSEIAASIGEALLHVEHEWPQAVILDLRLPDADGTVLLRRLHRDPRTSRVALVTGVPDLSTYVELMKFPPDILLRKPVDLDKPEAGAWDCREGRVGSRRAATAGAHRREPHGIARYRLHAMPP